MYFCVVGFLVIICRKYGGVFIEQLKKKLPILYGRLQTITVNCILAMSTQNITQFISTLQINTIHQEVHAHKLQES